MHARVVVVGAINTDLVISAPHLPAPGETVVGGGLQTFGGGKGANAAVAAARAGASVSLIGAVGADSAGHDALALLAADRVDTSGVAQLAEQPTGAALIVVDARGENQIALGPGANGAVSAAHVESALAARLRDTAVVLVSTEIPLAAVAAALACAARAQVRCVLNPAPVIAGLADLLAHGPLVTPNEIELELLMRGLPGADGSIEANLAAIAARTQQACAVTLGGEGCALRRADGSFVRIPAPGGTRVVDTTGAGDTFNGVLAARLAAGDDLDKAIATAVVAASLSVTARGARSGMPTARAIDDAVRAQAG